MWNDYNKMHSKFHYDQMIGSCLWEMGAYAPISHSQCTTQSWHLLAEHTLHMGIVPRVEELDLLFRIQVLSSYHY